MNSIALIIPYFGDIPEYYQLWEKTALNNSTIDFIIFTDVTSIQSIKNIVVHHMSFQEFAQMFQDKFDFEIVLDRPYKLCDYKPTYGYVLEQYISNYDFWGHCDIDLVFGDIRKFITDDLLSQFDKVYTYGHLTLYRNCESMNKLFMDEGDFPEFNHREVFQTSDIYAFDEYFGITIKTKRRNIKCYENDDDFFDILTISKRFVRSSGINKENKTVFYYDSGKLYERVLSNIVTNEDYEYTDREILYAHFQKRKIDCSSTIIDNKFYLVPNKFINQDEFIDKMVDPTGEVLYAIRATFNRKITKILMHITRYKRLKANKEISNLFNYIQKRKSLNKRFNENAVYLSSFAKKPTITSIN